jgi:putative ABC transport system permease protein
MNILEALRVAWSSLRANKLRSLLTTLGIIIGVGSVISLLAIGSGFQQFFNQQFSSFGVGVFYIGPFVDSRKVDEAQSAQLTAADGEAILQSGAVPAAKAVAISISGAEPVRAGTKRATYAINGTTPSEFSIVQNDLLAGNYYYDSDERDRARVAVIGEEVANNLFGGPGTAVGERIAIRGVGFEVIGVITTKQDGSGPGSDPKETIFVPYRTARDRLFRDQVSSQVDVGGITVQANSPDEVQDAIRQVTDLLRERHRLTYQNNDFTIIDLGQIASTVNGIIAGFNAFLTIVGGISLLVGGIGIMNIMLVSVTERTREIGLRKAVGARRRDILGQFLIEAVVLSLIGGALGIGLGYSLSFLGTWVLVSLFEAEGARASVTMSAVLLATMISAGIGVAFGFFPALQASRLNPIEALRYE